jgi:hypothetical protein
VGESAHAAGGAPRLRLTVSLLMPARMLPCLTPHTRRDSDPVPLASLATAVVCRSRVAVLQPSWRPATLIAGFCDWSSDHTHIARIDSSKMQYSHEEMLP